MTKIMIEKSGNAEANKGQHIPAENSAKTDGEHLAQSSWILELLGRTLAGCKPRSWGCSGDLWEAEDVCGA